VKMSRSESAASVSGRHLTFSCSIQVRTLSTRSWALNSSGVVILEGTLIDEKEATDRGTRTVWHHM
jgi:hypothetical protein